MEIESVFWHSVVPSQLYLLLLVFHLCVCVFTSWIVVLRMKKKHTYKRNDINIDAIALSKEHIYKDFLLYYAVKSNIQKVEMHQI